MIDRWCQITKGRVYRVSRAVRAGFSGPKRLGRVGGLGVLVGVGCGWVWLGPGMGRGGRCIIHIGWFIHTLGYEDLGYPVHGSFRG